MSGWYFEKCSRVLSQRWLSHPVNDNGAFLIRPSESVPNAYALSVRDGDEVKQYLIHSDKEGVTLNKRTFFRTLSQLVEYYSTPDLSIKLNKPCIPASNCDTLQSGVGRDPSIMAWDISRESLEFIQKLGEGRFGEMWEGLLENRTPVAIKCLKSKVKSSDGFAEANLMKTLDHPNLLRMYGVCNKEEPMWIVTELMKVNLLRFLRRSGKELMKLPRIINFGAQIASGMAYLENRYFIHRDLAARNLLLGDSFTVKIAHFRLATFTLQDINNLKAGTMFLAKWAAPEAALHNSFSIKSDVWSFGIVLTELVTNGAIPYPGMKIDEIFKQVLKGYRMPAPPGCPPTLYEIMLECWHKEPMKRPTFETLQWKLEDFFINDS